MALLWCYRTCTYACPHEYGLPVYCHLYHFSAFLCSISCVFYSILVQIQVMQHDKKRKPYHQFFHHYHFIVLCPTKRERIKIYCYGTQLIEVCSIRTNWIDRTCFRSVLNNWLKVSLFSPQNMEAPWFEDGFPEDVRRSTPGARIDLIKDIVTNLVWLLVREIKKTQKKILCSTKISGPDLQVCGIPFWSLKIWLIWQR